LVQVRREGLRGPVVRGFPVDQHILSTRGNRGILGVRSIQVVLLVPLVLRFVALGEEVEVVVGNTGNTAWFLSWI